MYRVERLTNGNWSPVPHLPALQEELATYRLAYETYGVEWLAQNFTDNITLRVAEVEEELPQ